jgi:hypothetical protein
MANRPIFIADVKENRLVEEKNIDFTWVKGMAISQKRKNIINLHKKGKEIGIQTILEISTKSLDPFGVRLSAFNLALTTESGHKLTVEAAFQGSKVFEYGGPYVDLYFKNGYEIKKDLKLNNSGKLIAFNFFSDIWDLEPKTAFYDWLYFNALVQNYELKKYLLNFEAFSDIEYNPNKKSKPLNCQARSAAKFVSLYKKGKINSLIKIKNSINYIEKEEFLKLLKNLNCIKNKEIILNQQLELEV